jgi:hypothetical protein
MNKTTKIIVSMSLVGILAVGVAAFSSAQASLTDKKEATKAVTEYVQALEKQDIDTMIRRVIDTRVKDQAELRRDYEYYARRKAEEHLKMKLINVEETKEGFTASFELTADHYKKTHVIMLPVVKDHDGLWKLYVDGSVVVENHDEVQEEIK